jgi:tRNA threonylcarbamoyladenosine biosynthesis protein TsaB
VHESLLGPSPEGRPLHSTRLLSEVEAAAAAVGGWGEVDLIAVGLGPGSFTGLRIALATARGLATSLGLPLAGVCTLDAIGRAMGEADVPAAGTADGGRLAVIDARRGEVFAALYGAAGERLWEPLVCPPEQLGERVAELPSPPWAAGSGALRFRQELARRGVEIPGDADPVHRVAARQVCALAAVGGDAGPLAPIYLRPPDAERWRERDSVPRSK